MHKTKTRMTAALGEEALTLPRLDQNSESRKRLIQSIDFSNNSSVNKINNSDGINVGSHVINVINNQTY